MSPAMHKISVRRQLAGWLMAAFWLAGLSLRAGSPATNAPAPAWPAPPAEPYIVHVRDLAGPKDIGAKASSWTRFANWITGVKANAENFSRPFGLSLNADGSLLVTDAGSGQVCQLDLAQKKWLKWKAAGKQKFSSPVAAVRHGETIFVADPGLGKIVAFDAGKGRLRLAITNELQHPSGLARLGDRLFVTDSQRHQVLVFGVDGKFLSAFGRRGSGPGEFNYPTHVSADAQNRVYVTDSMNYRLQVFDAEGKFLREFGSAGDGPGRFSRPKGVAVDSAGHVYVVDALFDNVQIFDEAGRLLLDLGGSGSEPGKFWLPNAIVINSRDEIFVADTYNGRIQVLRYTGKK
jgi:DNA-binding beta-propeller fold protein YncE